MRHRMGYKKLNRTSEHRKALIKNMLNSLVKYEQITTTLPKAKVLKPQADKLITLGKKDTLQNMRTLISKLQDEASASKIRKTIVRFSHRTFKTNSCACFIGRRAPSSRNCASLSNRPKIYTTG